MAGPLLLTYNLDARTEARLRVVCATQHIRFRPVAPEEYALPIGALAGIPVAGGGEPAGAAEGFADPMLVMCHMLSTQLNAFLQGMRTGGVPPVPLKAVLTPTNVAWDSRRLHDELAREHEAVSRKK